MFTPITMVLQLMNSLFYFLENARGASFPMACTSAVINSFQFTPLQEGLRDYNIRLWRAGYISIHAPARGASPTTDRFTTRHIFQFTPPREGLQYTAGNVEDLKDFNSRPRERGFRCTISHGTPKAAYFNSRPRERGFDFGSAASGIAEISIHAPARGASVVT